MCNDAVITYDEFSKALRKLHEAIDAMSDELNDFARKLVEAWRSVFSYEKYTEEIMADIAEAIDLYKKLQKARQPRQAYLKRKDLRLDSYRYVKVFKRNMPYHRRHYQSCN